MVAEGRFSRSICIKSATHRPHLCFDGCRLLRQLFLRHAARVVLTPQPLQRLRALALHAGALRARQAGRRRRVGRRPGAARQRRRGPRRARRRRRRSGRAARGLGRSGRRGRLGLLLLQRALRWLLLFLLLLLFVLLLAWPLLLPAVARALLLLPLRRRRRRGGRLGGCGGRLGRWRWRRRRCRGRGVPASRRRRRWRRRAGPLRHAGGGADGA